MLDDMDTFVEPNVFISLSHPLNLNIINNKAIATS